MAAFIIDDESQDYNEDNDSNVEELNQETPEQGQALGSTSEDEIPDKYRGKSVQEIVRMHQEAEKAIGRQSAEVGDLRKVVDQYIQTQLVSNNNQATNQSNEPEDEVDFFSDPEKAVQRAIDNHPKVREAEQFSANMRKTTALSTLQQKHPDMAQILSDPAFGNWIQASQIRTQLFIQADKQFDPAAADELFSMWKDRQGVVSQTVAAEKQTRKQAVRTASTGNATGSSEASARKIYRRADIVKLMQTEPDRYEALSEEILKAYSEGRVK